MSVKDILDPSTELGCDHEIVTLGCDVAHRIPTTQGGPMSHSRDASLYVCPLRLVPDVVERTGARHLVSAIDHGLLPATPKAIARDRHLRLAMHDIVEARADHVLPAIEHVNELLTFVENWDRRDPVLIHCYAGISRSTAAAFITLCALNPDEPEDLIASDLRRSSDTASPNLRFVSLADTVLGRGGRMVEAVRGMGPCIRTPECIPFKLSVTAGSKLHLDAA
jgi:predicted protein tyrosine phosphatase